MKLTVLTLGPIGTNCYLLYDEAAKAAAVIDPGDEAERIEARIAALDLEVRAILLTHGHFDHVGAAARLARTTGAPVYLHPADRELPAHLTRPLPETLPLAEGQRLDLGPLTFQVLHTPGHTPGGVCFRCEDLLFTGDTLFAGSCGRTDLGGSWPDLAASILRLSALEGDLFVLPGHGPHSTLAAEREGNPCLALAAQELKQ